MRCLFFESKLYRNRYALVQSWDQNCLFLGKTSTVSERIFFFQKRVSESFGFALLVFNDEPQKDKQQSKECIIFSQLVVLALYYSHVDYAEQFLSDKCLCNRTIKSAGSPLIANVGFQKTSLF